MSKSKRDFWGQPIDGSERTDHDDPVKNPNVPQSTSPTKRLFNNSQPPHYPNSEWYDKFGGYREIVKKYKITEMEVYDMYQNLVRVQKSNRYYFYPKIKRVSLVTKYFNLVDRNEYVRMGFQLARGIKHDVIYNEVVQLSQPLKEYPRLYKWYWDTVSTNTGSDLYRSYCMDHNQLVNHLMEIRGRRYWPEGTTLRIYFIIMIAETYQKMVMNKKDTNPLWTLARWTIGDFFP